MKSDNCKPVVRRAVRQHERAMHPDKKPIKLKLGKKK
jgi:hypothetical protein